MKRLRIDRPVQRFIDRTQNGFAIFKIVVPEAKNSVAFAFQPFRSRLVMGCTIRLCMLGAIDLDYQSRGHARKIGYIGSDGNLPPKVTARKWQ